MIQVAKRISAGCTYLKCAMCSQTITIRYNMPSYCSWCSRLLPNMLALVNNKEVRKEYHFKNRIYSVKVRGEIK